MSVCLIGSTLYPHHVAHADIPPPTLDLSSIRPLLEAHHLARIAPLSADNAQLLLQRSNRVLDNWKRVLEIGKDTPNLSEATSRQLRELLRHTNDFEKALSVTQKLAECSQKREVGNRSLSLFLQGTGCQVTEGLDETTLSPITQLAQNVQNISDFESKDEDKEKLQSLVSAVASDTLKGMFHNYWNYKRQYQETIPEDFNAAFKEVIGRDFNTLPQNHPLWQSGFIRKARQDYYELVLKQRRQPGNFIEQNKILIIDSLQDSFDRIHSRRAVGSFYSRTLSFTDTPVVIIDQNIQDGVPALNNFATLDALRQSLFIQSRDWNRMVREHPSDVHGLAAAIWEWDADPTKGGDGHIHTEFLHKLSWDVFSERLHPLPSTTFVLQDRLHRALVYFLDRLPFCT